MRDKRRTRRRVAADGTAAVDGIRTADWVLVASRTELATRALREGWLEVPPDG